MDLEMGKQKSSTTSFAVPSSTEKTNHSSRGFFMAQILLKILVIVFALTAALLMITSDQSVTIFGIVMQARYTYSSAFRFDVAVEFVVCVLSLLSFILVYAFARPNNKSDSSNYFYLLLHDMVIMVLLTSGVAAATAIGYVGKYGQEKTGWINICDRVGNFCHKVMLSIALSYLALISQFALTILSAYKLKSQAQNQNQIYWTQVA